MLLARMTGVLSGASGVIVPGVGHFGETGSLDDGWRDAILRGVEAGRPLFGICLGMQWLFDGSSEAPGGRGLGLLAGRCMRLDDRGGTLKIPHVETVGVARRTGLWRVRVLHALVCRAGHGGDDCGLRSRRCIRRRRRAGARGWRAVPSREVGRCRPADTSQLRGALRPVTGTRPCSPNGSSPASTCATGRS